jgi:hypothetical protein
MKDFQYDAVLYVAGDGHSVRLEEHIEMDEDGKFVTHAETTVYTPDKYGVFVGKAQEPLHAVVDTAEAAYDLIDSYVLNNIKENNA